MIEPLVLTNQGNHVPLEDGCIALEEARHYELRLPGISSAQVWLGALELPPSPEGGFALWVEHVVGENVLQVQAGELKQTWPVRIRPRAEKLPDSLWLAMVGEIEAWLPGASVGLAGAKHGEVAHDGVSLPLLIEALAPLVPALEKALRALLRHPREHQQTRLDDVPLRMARRVDREALVWLGRHPQVAQWLRPWEAADLEGPEPTLPQRLAFDTKDHPANRYISWLVVRVVSFLHGAIDQLRTLATSPHEDITRWCEARAARLELGARRLDALWRRSFLRQLRREPASEAALLVVLDDPAYARVHRIGRRFLSPLFRLDGAGDQPQAAVLPSFAMYELWCFLAVARQLQALLPVEEDWVWTWTGLNTLLRPTSTGTGARLVGRNPDQGEMVVAFNPIFEGFLSRAGRRRWSLSRQRRPDLEISWRPLKGEGAWICLDAKYRAGKHNLADAFSSVHIYRDSLRHDGMGGRCRAACLLAPSRTLAVEPWFSNDFRQAHACGIWEMRPGVTLKPDLGRWLIATLRQHV